MTAISTLLLVFLSRQHQLMPTYFQNLLEFASLLNVLGVLSTYRAQSKVEKVVFLTLFVIIIIFVDNVSTLAFTVTYSI